MVGPVVQDDICEEGSSDQLINNGQNRGEEQEHIIATVPQSVDEEITLLHLNEDCLRSIVNYLPFYHLNQVASTCTHLQYIARKVFRKFYNNNRLTYKKIKIMFHEDEIRNFGSLVERMWLHGCKINHLRLMTEQKCDKKLRRVIFSSLHYGFKCVPGDIESIFRNLEELCLFRCPTSMFMPFDHCTSLTRLECVGQFFRIDNVFPKLKYLRFEYAHADGSTSGENCPRLKNLLNKNKNLTELICHSYNSVIMELKELEKLVIRVMDLECCSVSNLHRLNKLKVLDLKMKFATENDLLLFLQVVPNPQILVELRLPRLRQGRFGSFRPIMQCIGRFTELVILKLDMTDLGSIYLHHLHSLKKVQQLKLKATEFVGTDALIECIGHMKALETISFYNVSETNLLLDATKVDIRLQQMYISRQRQLTIRYLKVPHNNVVVTEDYTDDLYEMRLQQNPYYLYRSIVFNPNSH